LDRNRVFLETQLKFLMLIIIPIQSAKLPCLFWHWFYLRLN